MTISRDRKREFPGMGHGSDVALAIRIPYRRRRDHYRQHPASPAGEDSAEDRQSDPSPSDPASAVAYSPATINPIEIPTHSPAARFRLISTLGSRISSCLPDTGTLDDRLMASDCQCMRILVMKKSTGAISLVLLGTALALAGCSSPSDDEDDPQQGGGGHGGHAGTHFVPVIRGGGFGRPGSVSATPSVRGGFGGIGSGGSGS